MKFAKILLFSFLMLVTSSLFAQKQKAETLYNGAIDLLQNGQMDKGIDQLLSSYKIDPNSFPTLIALGGAFNQVKMYDSSTLFYEKAKMIDVSSFQGYYLPYSVSLAGLGKFQDAMVAVNHFLENKNLSERSLSSSKSRKANYQFAIDYAKEHPSQTYIFKPENLGDAINSVHSEYYPSFTIDNKTLVFTRRTGGRREDFFESHRMEDGSYSLAKLMQGIINQYPYKGAINISQDGQWLIFAGDFPNQGYGDFDLYISYKTANGWSAPQNLGPNINTEFWESSPSLSPDKSVLYFSSNRPNGFGANDLYYSERQSDGSWGKAINMGAAINTQGEELAPQIHADNSTLYFTSSGLPGYGEQDLFVARKKSDGSWGTPENLGYPINTIDNEGSLFVSANAEDAYYASDRSDTKGELDLYSFRLRKDIQPMQTMYVKGKIVSSSENEKPLYAQIHLFDDSTHLSVNTGFSDNEGKYLVTLPVGKAYTMTVSKTGYLFHTDTFHLENYKFNAVLEKDIVLQKLASGISMVLNNILFDFNSVQLKPISQVELNNVIRLMQDNPSLKIEIDGYTDNIGSESFNQKLSENRVKSVIAYLQDKGQISAYRMTGKGFGKNNPIADNTTAEGQAKNRRTELKVISF